MLVFVSYLGFVLQSSSGLCSQGLRISLSFCLSVLLLYLPAAPLSPRWQRRLRCSCRILTRATSLGRARGGGHPAGKYWAVSEMWICQRGCWPRQCTSGEWVWNLGPCYQEWKPSSEMVTNFLHNHCSTCIHVNRDKVVKLEQYFFYKVFGDWVSKNQ